MKYKWPKKILVGGTLFCIKYDYEARGAYFSYPNKGKPGVVSFGMADHKVSPLIFLENIIHEFKEIIQVEQGSRIPLNDDSYIFHSTHGQHQDLCARLAGILKEFIQ